MTHLQHHVSPTEFKSIVNIEKGSDSSLLANHAPSIQAFAEMIRTKFYTQALEGTEDMDGKDIGTPEGIEQARKQMNVNFMEAESFNITPHVLYVPLDVFRAISESRGAAFEIFLDATSRLLSMDNGSIAPVVSDKDNMFMYRTSYGKSDQLEDAMGQIREELSANADMPENLFFEGLHTNPNSIKPSHPGISVEGFKKAHRLDQDGSFQRQIQASACLVGKLLEGKPDHEAAFWNWNPLFNFRDPSHYHHILPE